MTTRPPGGLPAVGAMKTGGACRGQWWPRPPPAARRGIERWFGLTERALRQLHSVRRELEDANQTVDGLIDDIEHYEHDRAVQG